MLSIYNNIRSLSENELYELSNSYYFDINSQYNYYVSNYEDTFNQDFSYLNLIPNYHAVNSYLINDNTSTHAHLTLGNKVEISKQFNHKIKILTHI